MEHTVRLLSADKKFTLTVTLWPEDTHGVAYASVLAYEEGDSSRKFSTTIGYLERDAIITLRDALIAFTAADIEEPEHIADAMDSAPISEDEQYTSSLEYRNGYDAGQRDGFADGRDKEREHANPETIGDIERAAFERGQASREYPSATNARETEIEERAWNAGYSHGRMFKENEADQRGYVRGYDDGIEAQRNAARGYGFPINGDPKPLAYYEDMAFKRGWDEAHAEITAQSNTPRVVEVTRLRDDFGRTPAEIERDSFKRGHDLGYEEGFAASAHDLNASERSREAMFEVIASGRVS